MNVTKITVGYQKTANLGNYSNVRPSATLEVTLTEDDNVEASFAAAQALVRTAVQREVDDALEANDQAPRYTTDARYTLFLRSERQSGGLPDLVVIGPADATYPGLSRSHTYKGFRLPAIRRLAREGYPENRLVDTTIEPDALAPLLEQIAAENAQLEEERRQRQLEQERQYQERQRRYEQQAAAHDGAADDEGDDDDDE